LVDENPEIRALAARELGGFEHPEMLPILAAAARDRQSIVALNAIEGLANYRDPIAIPYLLDLAKDGGLIGEAALNRAVMFGDPRVLSVARTLLTKSDVTDKLAAIRVIGELGTTDDVQALRAIETKETELISSKARGFGLMPQISLSRAAKAAIQ